MKKIIVIPFLVLVFAFSAAAQPNELTLKGAVQRAVENNLDLKSSLKTQDELAGLVQEVRSLTLPDLSFVFAARRFDNPTIPKPANAYMPDIQLTQLIYSFGKVSSAVAAAKIQEESYDNVYNYLKNEISFAAAASFYSAFLYENNITLITESIKRYEEHLNVTKIKYDAGAATRLDYLKTQVALKNLYPRLTESENKFKQQLDYLKFLLNADLNEEIKVICSFPAAEEKDYTLYISKFKQFAYENHPSLKIVNSNMRSLEEQIKLTKAEYYPTIYFQGNAGYLASKTSGLFKTDNRNWSAGISVSFPIFDGYRTKGKLKQLYAKRDMLEFEREKQKKEIEINITKAADEVKKAQEDLKTGAENLSLAKEALRVSEISYKSGVLTNMEVLDSQLQVIEAELNMSNAGVNYLISVARLKKELSVPLWEDIEKYIE